MSENKVKQPMSKAKKEFIAAIIILVSGVILIIAGAIALTIIKNRALNIALGCVFIVCGAVMIGSGIFLMIKNKKIMNKEKAIQQ